MEVMSVYPAYDGDKDYDYDTAQYTFPHRKRTYNEEDNSEDYFENAVYEDSVNFSSMASRGCDPCGDEDALACSHGRAKSHKVTLCSVIEYRASCN